MYKQELGIALSGKNSKYQLTEEEQLDIYKKTGFDGYYVNIQSDFDRVKQIVDYGNKRQLKLYNVHGPYKDATSIWHDGELGDVVINRWIDYVRLCGDVESPILVLHACANAGMRTNDEPLQVGIDRVAKLSAVAKKCGVIVAFENVEGPQLLDAIMRNFSLQDGIGFCWDTGHEMCYDNPDVMALYGKRLVTTHLNDNLGISNPSGDTLWIDDLHFLPFDGVKDWHNVAQKLVENGFQGPLGLEVDKYLVSDRIDSYRYEKMTYEEYYAEAYRSVCKLAKLVIDLREKK